MWCTCTNVPLWVEINAVVVIKKQVLGIKNEAARMKVTPPLAVASLAHGDDMRWNPNDNGIDFNP